MHVAPPTCAWLLLSFFPLPVGNPVAAQSTLRNAGVSRNDLSGTNNKISLYGVRVYKDVWEINVHYNIYH